MRTLSYLLKQNEDGTIEGTAALRGAICYTGRILLEEFEDEKRVDRMLSYGPIDMVGSFEEECEGKKNPVIIQTIDNDSKIRLPKEFRSGPVKLGSFQEFRNIINNFTHYNSINLYVYTKNKSWFFAKDSWGNFQKLTKQAIFLDEEDYG